MQPHFWTYYRSKCRGCISSQNSSSLGCFPDKRYILFEGYTGRNRHFLYTCTWDLLHCVWNIDFSEAMFAQLLLSSRGSKSLTGILRTFLSVFRYGSVRLWRRLWSSSSISTRPKLIALSILRSLINYNHQCISVFLVLWSTVHFFKRLTRYAYTHIISVWILLIGYEPWLHYFFVSL